MADRFGLTGQSTIFEDETGVFFEGPESFGGAVRGRVQDAEDRLFVTPTSHRNRPQKRQKRYSFPRPAGNRRGSDIDAPRQINDSNAAIGLCQGEWS